MSVNAAFDVVIAMTFIYLLLSLLCTSANECIASLLRLRARNLYSELSKLIDDPDMRQAFWQSGLIRSLSRSGGGLRQRVGLGDAAGLSPSYIPRDVFVAALLKAARKGNDAKALKTPKDIKALFDNVEKDSLIGDVLNEIVETVEDDVEAVKKGVGEWFDRAMERTAGAYKRNLQAISFAVALVLACLVNADSLVLARAVWFDDTLRTQLAESAYEFAQEADSVDDMIDFEQIQEDLRPLPLGWDLTSPPLSTDWYRSTEGVVAKIVGLLLTAFAMTLGAPFWFDLLSRFVKLRGAGPGSPRTVPGVGTTNNQPTQSEAGNQAGQS